MSKLTAKEKLMQRAKAAKKTAEKKEESSSVTVTELKKVTIKNRFNLSLCEDAQVNIFLNEKGDELYSNEINSNIEAGRILTEVFDKLGGSNRYDGLYNAWLDAMEYNARTALRHRVRYNLYQTAKTEDAKELFSTLPVRLLDQLNVHTEREQLISLVNNSDIKTKKELSSFMDSEDIKEVNVEFKPATPFYKSVFSYKKKIGKMAPKEADMALSELQEIKKEVDRLEKLLRAKAEE